MKKKLLLLLGVLLALPAFAQDFTYEGIIYTVIDEDAKTCQTKEGYHVKGQNYKSYQNVTGDLVLPAYPKNGDTEYKLTEIADWSFYNLTGITSLTLPATIQRIGEGAFYCCKQLSNVILNEGLESIGDAAFQDCGIKNITIPSTIVSMGQEPFLSNPMESITMLSIMPPFNEYSGVYAIFYYTSTTTTVLELTKENASNYLNSEFNMFANINVDGKLLQKYTYNGLDYLLYDTGDPAHGEAVLLKGDYNDLTNVQIPARFDVGADENKTRYYVKSMNIRAFANCKNLQSVTFDPNSKLTKIPGYAFARSYNDPEGVYSISLPKTLTEIGPYAFSYCNFSEITLPESVQYIGEGAFGWCKNLERINIPEGITEIKEYTFACCEKLAEVKLPNSLLKICGEQNSYGAFECTPALKEITFPDALEEIGWSAFSESGLSSINFGSGLKTIGRGAFLECRNVKSLTLPEGLETIEGYAFAGHNGYSYLYLPSTLISVGDCAFQHHSQRNDNYLCESLAGSIEILEVPTLELFTSIDWDNQTYIGTNPLIYTEDLRIDGKSVTELVIPDNVTEINRWWALTGWKNLKSIVIPSTIKSLLYHWGYPNKIEKITIEDSDQPLKLNIRKYPIIDNDAYGRDVITSYNLNIDNVYIGRNFTSDTQQKMGFDGLFEGSTVKEVMLGNDKTEVLPNSFKDCKELTKISFGHSITTIGESAFEGCSALNEVVFPPMLETIGAKAFNGCPDLKYIAMGYNVKSIGEQAFGASTPEQVLITAITPPTAKDNTFAGYSGQLFLHNEEAMNNYYEALYCWGKFFDDKYEAMTLPETIECEYQTIEGNQGDQIQLTAIIKPANVSLPHVFWHSTNSAHASVDPTGLVTFHDTNSSNPESHLLSIRPMAAEAPCKIVATSLFMDSPVFEVLVNPTSQPAQEGDLNGDGTVDASDLQHLINYISGDRSSGITPEQADINNDGKVDSHDLQIIINLIVNN